jgi:hypothetical protein
MRNSNAQVPSRELTSSGGPKLRRPPRGRLCERLPNTLGIEIGGVHGRPRLLPPRFVEVVGISGARRLCTSVVRNDTDKP